MSTRPTKAPALTIFYHFDPWSIGVGGIDAMIRNWVRYAPDGIELRIVGATAEAGRQFVWYDREMEGRSIRFMSVYTMPDPTIKPRIPNALRFTLGLARAGSNLASEYMHFHRIEPSLVASKWLGHKTLFFHVDLMRSLQAAAPVNEHGWRRFPRLYGALERMLIRRFDRVYECNSESLGHHRRIYPEISERIRYFRNCVDTDLYRPLATADREVRRLALARRLGVKQTTRFILFAGRLQLSKNPMLLLDAFRRIQDPDAHLLIAGDGNLRASVSSRIEALGMSRRVSVLGAVPANEVRDLLQVSEMTVLTSTHEGLPMVVLESLACGTPVVTTRCGETPSFLGKEVGVVCDDASADGIAGGLSNVLRLRASYSPLSCAAVAAQYSARTVIGNAYQEILHGEMSARPCLQGAAG